MSDLGEAVDAQKEQRTLARLDGKPAVVLQVQRQSGVNTDETIDAAFFDRTRLPSPLSASVPETLADLDVFEQTNRLILK